MFTCKIGKELSSVVTKRIRSGKIEYKTSTYTNRRQRTLDNQSNGEIFSEIKLITNFFLVVDV